MLCSLHTCSEWCRDAYGKSVGAADFGCQIIDGVETFAFCECSDGGRKGRGVTQAVLCHEPLVCPTCEHGYCSTSPIKNNLFNNACVICEPGFVLLPNGTCVNTLIDSPEAVSIYTCPSSYVYNPCLHGVCVDGDAVLGTPFFCKCNQGFEGPLCESGAL